MRTILLLSTLLLMYSAHSQKKRQIKTIHVFVALCDNLNQGIVPVSKTLGDGQNPRTNLYWGALYGVKTHFKRSKDWTLVKKLESHNSHILERILFKHTSTETYLLAEAYDGKYIKETTIDFLKAASGGAEQKVKGPSENELSFGGASNMVAYIGHNGLMEFDVEGNFKSKNKKKRDAIMLACISKDYFKPYLKETGAQPLVWSTGLMSPEAYTLAWSIQAWIAGETPDQIRESAAQAYHKYQKCGVRAARNLLVTGYE
ncbi:hypothetical protein [Spongiimicrobium salis]|uniref:hypothetical protein n=1 Tax=Spongiimicrobium salis TaxID=1667022 RepID=UPI00374D8EE7